MAWRSSGNTNAEMVSSLRRFEVISSLEVEEGFRNVDRKLFVPQSMKYLAYKDQPIKEDNGNVHISAPHIYGSVLEAMELKRGASLSVLHAGSGTGYLTCIIASILGHRSVHYCVDVHKDVVDHSRESIARWKEAHQPAQKMQNIHLIHGNVLQLDPNEGECALGFDLIYIGAAISKRDLPRFKSMLKPGGILVGPVEDELVKCVRMQASASNEKEYTLQVLSGVIFAPLVKKPGMKTVIQASVWSPTNHLLYPDTFRKACEQILLCSQFASKNANFGSSSESGKPTNATSLLPRAMWIEVLKFCSRDWFEPPLNELEFLRKRLQEQQAMTEMVNKARLEAEARAAVAEREREIYRLLSQRYENRLAEANGARGNDEEYTEHLVAGLLLEARNGPAIGVGNLFRQFRNRLRAAERGGDQDSDDDDDEEEEEEDSDDDDNEMEEDQEDESGEEEEAMEDEQAASDEDGDADMDMGVSMSDPRAFKTRSKQPRTVSMSEDDL